MSFQVKATVVGFLGDTEKYPCHFLHEAGDEFIYDGEKFVGKICPSVLRLLIPVMMPFHAVGPRFMPPPGYYYPFFYSTCSRRDPSRAIYDGLGFENVFEKPVEAPYHMANMAPPGAFQWPPIQERTIAMDAGAVICPDMRTAMVIKCKAIDLSDKGYDIPYFRRQMVIMDRASKRQGMPVSEILDLFSKEEQQHIHPALSPILIDCLIEELTLMNYMEIKDGKAFVTDSGKNKAENWKAGLSAEESKALKV
jgi:uncharacterized repeat protein (TIGR04076 family)